MDYRPWIADRSMFIFPILGYTLYILRHFAGGHPGYRRNLALLGLPRCEHRDTCSTDIDHQNRLGFPGGGPHDFFSTWPPNPNRIAESNLSAKSSSPLDANR